MAQKGLEQDVTGLLYHQRRGNRLSSPCSKSHQGLAHAKQMAVGDFTGPSWNLHLSFPHYREPGGDNGRMSLQLA
jgi:hypothetical protein